MAKKSNQKKDSALQMTQQDTEQSKKSLSKLANHKLEESLKEFSKLSEKERNELPGNKEFFEQFWEYFKQQHPNLLDEIDNQEKLTIYVQNLEEKGFSIENLMKNSKELHKDFKETNNEKESIIESLKKLQQHCNNPENKMPTNIFNDFANDINLKTTPSISIDKKTKISKIGNLFSVWTNYLENNSIKLKDHQKLEAEKILSPRYVPTERLLISATIKKIKKNLPDTLITDFEAAFPLPIDIHSSFENLKDLKQQRTLFLDGRKNVIDENLAKKLDKIIITNGDIYKELQYEGEKIEWTKGFGQQTENFRRMFNSLATRQIFEEAKEKGTYIENHLELLGKEFKDFPPYFNELLNIPEYQYKHKNVIENQPVFKTEYDKQEAILKEKEAALNAEKPDSEKDKSIEQRREERYQELLKEKEKLNTIRRKAYAAYINQKNPEVGTIVNDLVENKFDMAKLSKSDQQKIINILVTKKLGDSIKNQIPQTLKLDPKEYKEFVENLFDLNQKDIVIPTQYGNIPLHFLEKNFFGGPTKELMEINNSGMIITEKHNLPLNFKVEITEQNKEFFEDNIIFEDLFKPFNSKKGPIKLNDSYKVSIKRKDGTSVEGYLSQQIPTKELQEEIEGGSIENGRFLYSHPITRPEDAREIMTREGTPEGTPIAIPESKQGDYDIDIVSKEINLNGEGVAALLFSHTLGQYNVKNDLNKDQEKKLAQKFGKLDKNTVYKDTGDMLDKMIDQEKRIEEKPREKIREKEYEEFLEERKSLKGYQEKGKPEENIYGFKKGAKLLIQGPESGFEPMGSFQYITAEISDIDKELGVFKVKFTGNEQSLGKREGTEKQFPLAKKGLQKFKDIWEEGKIFKLPNKEICNNIKDVIATFEDSKIDNIEPGTSFQGTSRNGNNFVMDMGKEEGKEVTHFGVIETLPGESQNEESKTGYMYKIEHEPIKKRFKVIANDKEKTTIHLDYPNFVLFVASKKLQPKTEESSKGIDIPEKEGPTIDKPKKRKGYSIASVLGLFKNFGKKVGDSLKKYEEEQIEDLTEDMFFHGKLFHKLAGIMPSKKLQESFESVGDEYLTERDNKVWKKIEKYQKFYESDPDFGSKVLREERIQPYLEGKKPFKDHHQAAAMLLATTKKGKGPYSRNTDRAGKGNRVRILFGEGHQKRYLLMKEKLQRELDQGYKVHGQIWADNLQNEILKLEMKYITHCVDGRQLAERDDVPRLEGMFSKKFAGTLEEETNKFFSESVSGSSKEKGYSFELARFEYFRLLADRPQQAIPCLKQIAAKAVTPNQWRVFESAVLTGMLSGAFYNITQEDKSFIQKICRAIGFLPGMWIRDPNHHHKVEHFIKIATGENLKYEVEKTKNVREEKNYKSDIHGFGKGENLKQFKVIADYNHGLNLRLTSANDKGTQRLKQISEFAAMKGQNFEGKSLIELINDPTTPIETIYLLKEIEKRSLEKDEEVDPDIKMNGYGLEQNILAKNQSLIDEITDFQEGKFKGKNKDEIQGIQTARTRIAKDIPRKEIKDKNQVIYLLKKFMNWFEGRGFNTEEKKFLIRTLLTAKEEIDKGHGQSADEMLWYVTVGNIVKNSGNGQAPDELINGLEAFKDFFKNNLNTILESDVIEQSLGSMYLEAKNKGAFEVGPWEEYVDLTKNKFFIGRSKEENKTRNEKQKKYKNPEIINEKIYEIAKQVNQRNHIENKFDRYFNPETTKTISDKLHETLEKKNVRFKNPETAGKIRHILSGKDNSENLSDDDIAAAAQMEEEGYYGGMA